MNTVLDSSGKTDLHWPVEGTFNVLSRYTWMGNYQPLDAQILRNLGNGLLEIADELEKREAERMEVRDG